ncbi:MAG: hypothetical protein E7J78_08280 [Pantoea sp.]|nr:hypothetical protein [Pantoea sp.]
MPSTWPDCAMGFRVRKLAVPVDAAGAAKGFSLAAVGGYGPDNYPPIGPD